MLDMDQMQEEQQRIADMNKEGGGDFLDNFVKMPEKTGAVAVRILGPAKPGTFDVDLKVPYQWTRVHRVNERNLHCPRTQIKGANNFRRWVAPTGEADCPICQYYSSLWKRAEKLPQGPERKRLEDKARSIKPIERYYYNVIVRQQYNEETNQMEENVGPKILSVGITLHSMILRAFFGDPEIGEPKLGDITDVTGKTGRDFQIVKRMKKSGDNKVFADYATSKFLEPSPAGNPEEIERWESTLHDLSKMRTLKPAEELDRQLKIHNGVIADDGHEDFDYSQYEKADGTGGEPKGRENGNEDDDAEPAVRETPKPRPQARPPVTKTATVKVPADEDVENEAAGDTAPPAVTKTAAAVEAPSDGQETEALAEDEFMEKLRNMKAT